MDEIILKGIKRCDATEVVALMTESFKVNDPFALSGEWTE
jgi:hypothetical protein